MSGLKVRVGLDRQVVDFESPSGGDLAVPLAEVVRELADGRRYGEFTINGALIRYADVTDVEMTWTK